MGVAVSWDDAERTIIRYDFESSWSVREFAQAMNAAVTMAAFSGTQTDVIINRPGSKIPDGALPYVQRVMLKLPADSVVVVVEDSAAVRPLIGTLRSVEDHLADQIYLATDLQEAHEVISRARAERVLDTG
jgi:hypothetical protein